MKQTTVEKKKDIFLLKKKIKSILQINKKALFQKKKHPGKKKRSMSNSSTTTSPAFEESSISLGAIIGIVFACAILGQLCVVGCYIWYRRKIDEIEHKTKVATMHNAFMDAVENERQKGNEQWGSYSNQKNGNLQVQRDVDDELA